MTSVAAPDAGNELAGFARGARVEYDLTDGTTVHGKIVVPGTDKIGSAHGIELDTDGPRDELHWIGTGFVRPEGTGRPAAPQGPDLTPAQERAMDGLTGHPRGQLRKGQGVQLSTARVLHRLGLAYLDERAFDNGDWLLTLVEPVRQTIEDEELLELDVEEAALLAPLEPKRRYRALRHAHIVSRFYAEQDRAAGYPQLAKTRPEALREVIPAMLHWASARPGSTRFLDMAGRQWKAAREAATNVWNIGRSWGEPLLVVEAITREEAHAKAEAIVADDPVGYKELVGGFGSRRLTVQEWADARRLAAAVAEAA